MRDKNKTKTQLILELEELRQKVVELEVLRSQNRQPKKTIKTKKDDLQYVLDNIPAYVFLKDREHRLTLVNEALIEATGRPKHEWIGKTVFELFSDKDLAQKNYHDDEEVMAGEGQTKLNIIETLPTLEGIQWLQTQKVPLKDETGHVKGLVASSINISKRKELEDTLVKKEHERTAILDSLVEHVVYSDREMKILWANEAACESVGMKREDLLGRKCHDVWADRQTPCEDCPVIKARDTGQVQMAEKMTPDGRWWHIKGYPVRDSHGQLTGMTELTLDITERKRGEEIVRNARHELEIKVAERTAELTEANENLRQEIEIRKESQKELKVSQMLISSTFDALQDMLVVIDKDLRVVMSNWKDHEYISEKERQGHPFCYEVFMNRKKPCDSCLAMEVFATGETKQLEATNPIDGKIRDMYLLPMFDDKGKVVAVIEHLRDITTRKQAEEALQDSENRFRELFNNMSNGVAVYRAINDGEDFVFVDFNNAAERLDNIKKENLIGKSLLDSYPGVKEFGLFDVLQRVWRTGKPQQNPVCFFEDDRISAWRENNAYRLPSGEIVCVYEDITHRKQMEEALRKSQQRFKSIFENAPIGFYRTTPGGRILDANPVLIQVLGYTTFEELATVNLESVGYHPEYSRREFKERIERDGEIMGMESLWKRSDGSVVHIRENARAIRDADGKIKCYEGTIEDISDQKQADEQIRSLSQQLIKVQEDERQMISRELHDRVAQDLSTLLIGLNSISDHRPNVVPEVRKKALELSELLRGTIETVRDLSYDLRLPGLNDMGLIPALSMYCEEFAEASGLKVDFQATGMSALKLDFDTEMNLYRLIQEGLSNIRKHAAADEATVKLIGTYPNIILRIEDDGKGFDVETRARTIDSEKRMGLRSMAERVSLIRGEMTIQSQARKGTRVLIKFPYQEEEDD
jgi:PAS domain S-box-containing protein